MKAKAGAAMSKSAIAAALATSAEVKPAVCKKLLETLAEVATKEVEGTGKFTIPGLCMLKTRKKPATKAGKKGVWQGGDGEGQASHHRGEGILRFSAQEEHLRSLSVQLGRAQVGIPLVLHGRQVSRRSACISHMAGRKKDRRQGCANVV